MAALLVETKLFIPRLRRSVVARPRLTERLSRGAESRLTLISAPAGFGKTTLLAEWLAAAAADNRSVAWLSVEESDTQAASFWTYVITALQTVVPGLGASVLPLLQSTQAPIDAVLATLVNDLHAVPNEIHLVLDDYHLADVRDVQDGLAFLLEHLPPQVHLVIASRADPGLPLARLRARGELVEIRAADLRFTPEEAAAYLNEVMGLALTTQHVAALEERTEGWIAALQLAALSMQGRDDIAGFIAGFAGDDRYIVDYLAEEVLHRQPEHVRNFLLQTCILDRLSGPLCDAVTGQDSGKAMLAELDRGNLFLTRLDDRRRWYRYHHLFAEVLQAHLLDGQADDVPDLHQRASAWYEQNGHPSEAIGHALAAQDFERAADLVEMAIPAMRRTRQEAVVRAWLMALPEELLRVRPVLSVTYAGALLISGETQGVEDRLRDAEQWLEPATARRTETLASGRMVVVDEEEFRRLPAAVEVYRAALTLALGDAPGTVMHARRALEISPEDDHLGRASAAGLLGLTFWASGDLEGAHRAYSECLAGLQRAGYVADTLGCSLALADIRRVQGRLGEAMGTYEQALRRAGAHEGSALRGTADMHVGMSEIHRERNDLPGAKQALLRSRDLGEYAGLPQNRYRSRVAMARVREAEGDLRGALDLLEEAERLYVSDYFPNVRPIPSMKARVRVLFGEVGEALDWARERGLSADDDLSYLSEFEHLTLARVLVARCLTEGEEQNIHEATGLLERLFNAAQEGERTGSAIEILVTQAVAKEAQDDLPGALESLQRALTLAEPEGYLRVFVDEGPHMESLLRAAAKRGISPGYVRRILAAFTPAVDGPAARPGLTDPLSERELDVLRLLGTDQGGPAIARQLVVSLNTVRTHTKNIYTKLGVNSRRAAVRRARELNLLARTREG